MKPPKIIISYHDKDFLYKEQLEKSLILLQKSGSLVFWDKSQTMASSERVNEFHQHLDQASHIIPLVSADYIICENIATNELNPALLQSDKNRIKIIPIKIKACLIEDSSLASFLALDFNYLSKKDGDDEAWIKIVSALKEVIKKGSQYSDYNESGLLDTEETFNMDYIVCQLNRNIQVEIFKNILIQKNKTIVPVIIYGNIKHEHNLLLTRIQRFFEIKLGDKQNSFSYNFPTETNNINAIYNLLTNSILTSDGLDYKKNIHEVINDSNFSTSILSTSLSYQQVVNSSYQIVKYYIDFWQSYEIKSPNKTVIPLLQIKYSQPADKMFFSSFFNLDKKLHGQFSKWKNTLPKYAQHILPALNFITDIDLDNWFNNYQKQLILKNRNIVKIKTNLPLIKKSKGYYLSDIKRIIDNAY